MPSISSPTPTPNLQTFSTSLLGVEVVAISLAAAGVYGWFSEQGAVYFGGILVFIVAEL